MFFVPRQKWHSKRNCANVSKEIFFPTVKGQAKKAIAICMACSVRDECLKYALDNNIEFGIWGGKTEKERKKLVA